MMPSKSLRLASILVLAAVAASAFFAGTLRGRVLELRSAQGGATSTPTSSPTSTPTATPEPGLDPIYSESEAEARSLEMFPAGHAPSTPATRLISHGSLEEQWLHVATGPGVLSWHANHPVWLVGILGTDLTVDIATGSLGIPGVTGGGDTRSVDGIYYAWDANSGSLRSAGPLMAGSPRSYVALQALQDESLTIVKATQVVLDDLPTATPEP